MIRKEPDLLQEQVRPFPHHPALSAFNFSSVGPARAAVDEARVAPSFPAMNRQALGPLLVGIISVGSGLWVALQLRIDRCLDAGGRWDPASRTCDLPASAPPGAASYTLADFAVGGAVMLAFGFMLMRMWAAIVKRKQLEAIRGARDA